MSINRELIKNIARLAVLVQKTAAEPLEIARFFNELNYAKVRLAEFEQIIDEEMMTLCLTIRAQLGLMSLAAVTEPPNKAQQTQDDHSNEIENKRKGYQFGARG